MGIFSIKHHNPLSDLENQKNRIKKQLNNFYGSLFDRNNFDFYRTDVMDYMGSVSASDQQILSNLLLEDMQNNRIYASFQERCPNPDCNRMFLEGAVIPFKNAGSKFSLLFTVGQVALYELNLVCPYCQTKIPKEKNIELASQTVIYHLTPEFRNWYLNEKFKDEY